MIVERYTWLAKRWLWYLGGGVLLVVSIAVLSIILPYTEDWQLTYRPAARALLAGKNPYTTVEIFFAAPWCLIPLLPLAMLPVNIGRACLLLMGFGCYTYTAYKMGARPWALMAFLLSPPVLLCFYHGNISWMPLLGFILPPRWGMLLLAVKPQSGLGVAIFYVVEAWREGGWKKVVHVITPTIVALLISFALFGLWPLRFDGSLEMVREFNASQWPLSIIPGIVLLVTAIRKRDIRFAMGASPCLSPVVLLYGWSGAVLALVSTTAEMLMLWLAMWCVGLVWL